MLCAKKSTYLHYSIKNKPWWGGGGGGWVLPCPPRPFNVDQIAGPE